MDFLIFYEKRKIGQKEIGGEYSVNGKYAVKLLYQYILVVNVELFELIPSICNGRCLV